MVTSSSTSVAFTEVFVIGSSFLCVSFLHTTNTTQQHTVQKRKISAKTSMIHVKSPASSFASAAAPLSVGPKVTVAANGTAVGEWIGTAVGAGCAVGAGIGIALGDGIGAVVGVAVGTGIGKAVGAEAGMDVGAETGTAVGAGVGTGTGTAVGADTQMPFTHASE